MPQEPFEKSEAQKAREYLKSQDAQKAVRSIIHETDASSPIDRLMTELQAPPTGAKEASEIVENLRIASKIAKIASQSSSPMIAIQLAHAAREFLLIAIELADKFLEPVEQGEKEGAHED